MDTGFCKLTERSAKGPESTVVVDSIDSADARESEEPKDESDDEWDRGCDLCFRR